MSREGFKRVENPSVGLKGQRLREVCQLKEKRVGKASVDFGGPGVAGGFTAGRVWLEA